MNTISFIESLMRFNLRVLEMGDLEEGVIYTMQELKEKLFFNQIFMSNTHEMFQKYACNEIIEEYIEGVEEYTDNIDDIINHIENNDVNTRISRYEDFDQRLYSEINIKDDFIVNGILPRGHKLSYKFLPDIIYYLTLFEGMDNIVLSFIDPRHHIYDITPYIKRDHLYPGYTIYYKSDDCIINRISNRFEGKPTVAIKVTTLRDDPSMVTKVEFNGKKEYMEMMKMVFPDDVLIISNPYIYTDDIKRIINMGIKEIPKVYQSINKVNIFQVFEKDILLEHPMTSFDAYIQLLTDAIYSKASSIYISLYRIGEDPNLYYALKDAVIKGIYVHVNIELKVSGEEKMNEFWTKEFRNAGIRVTNYASSDKGFKVHSKLTLIKFEYDRFIAHIGTGNYHPENTSQYTDLSLLTSDANICRQIHELFMIFNGEITNSQKFDNNLLVTRYNANNTLIDLIALQASLKERGYIAIKCNGLDDKDIIKALDTAANKGCKIDLIIRGVCTWIPDDLGKNVMIKSIIWDKLEHSRIFCFGSKDPIMYIGSLDLMHNKLRKRIETLVKIKDPDVLHYVCEYLNKQIINTKNSWKMSGKSGRYRRM